MEWLSSAAMRTLPLPSSTGLGLRLISVWVNFSYNQPENIRFNHCGNLIPELELFQNLLNVRRETVEIRLKIRF